MNRPATSDHAALSNTDIPQRPEEPSKWSWFWGWAWRLSEFGAVQALVQLLGAIVGLLFVRTLPKDSYAHLVILGSMLATSNMLAELGIGIGVRAIGGRVWRDRVRFGQLLISARQLRVRFALVALGLTLPALAFMLHGNGAGPGTTIALGCVLVVALIPQLSASILITSPQLHGEVRRLQGMDLAHVGVRLLLAAALVLSGKVTAVLAGAATAAANWLQFVLLRRWAAERADMSAGSHPGDRKELWDISLRVIPNTLFSCVQGQLLIWLVGSFGNAPATADVGALGRLAVMFGIATAALNSVVLPRFAACQDPLVIRRRYLQLAAAMAAFAAGFVGLAALFSPQFLWLLGGQYAHLRSELLVLAMGTAAHQFGGALWSMNAARAWVKHVWIYIPATLGAQVLLLQFLDVGVVREALWFHALSAIPTILLNVWIGWRGLSGRDVAMFRATET